MTNDIFPNKVKLAIEGGAPVRNELLPYGKQFDAQVGTADILDETIFICSFDE
jgi:hypothetical protein